MRSLSEIIEAAGGPRGIESASDGAITRDAVYKWPSIGIPDRHWEVLIPLAASTPEELYRANRAARGSHPNDGGRAAEASPCSPPPGQGEAAFSEAAE